MRRPLSLVRFQKQETSVSHTLPTLVCLTKMSSGSTDAAMEGLWDEDMDVGGVERAGDFSELAKVVVEGEQGKS